MKFFHLSDLHLGRRMYEFSLIEDQKFILEEILRLAEKKCPDAVVIAGDIYDRAVPSAEAVELFDGFLRALSERHIPVLCISGNHDSPERIAFGASLMTPSGVYLSPVYNGSVEPVALSDAFGDVRFYLLPFIKPANVRRFYPDAVIESYTDAVRCAVENMEVNPAARNVLITHQFVTGGVRSDSEEITVGGTDNVDAAVFDIFDYVALGHLHGAQKIGRETLRYSGTPLKYSFSEKDQEKSVALVELGAKGDISVSTLLLTPRRDLREIRGTYTELTLRDNYAGSKTEDYIHAVLTDENDVPNALARLRGIYPNLMKLDYDNLRTRSSAVIAAEKRHRTMSGTELFAELYERQNGQKLSAEQSAYAKAVFAALREDTP